MTPDRPDPEAVPTGSSSEQGFPEPPPRPEIDRESTPGASDEPGESGEPNERSRNASEPLTPIRLTILGKVYPLKVAASKVAMFQAMGEHLNTLLRGFRAAHPTQPDTTLHVLASLELAGELWTARAELQELEEKGHRTATTEPEQGSDAMATLGEQEREGTERVVLERVNRRLEELLEEAQRDL